MVVRRIKWRDGLLFGVAIVLAWLLVKSNIRQEAFAQQGREAHDYLCYQKTVGIPKQIDASNSKIQTKLDYINKVRLGTRKPIPGITFNDIQVGIQADQDDIARFMSTLRALNRVHC